MSVNYVPPRDANFEQRRARLKQSITSVLSTYIVGRGAPKKIDRAAEELILALKPMLKMPGKPDKGATVMTEAASMKTKDGDHRKGPSNL